MEIFKSQPQRMAFLVLSLMVVAGAGTPAQATGILFDFSYATISTTANDAAIQSYMNGLLTSPDGSPGWGVTVLGAEGPNFESTTRITTVSLPGPNGQYTGDGHVVGPCGTTCQSLTLGNNPDTRGAGNGMFIMADGTNKIPAVTGDAAITMKFQSSSNTPISVTGLTFDFEIFPDNSCLTYNNCGTNQSHLPDFTFVMTQGGKTYADTTVYAVTPGTVSTIYTNTGSPMYSPTITQTTTDQHSPQSGISKTEKAPQYLGTMSFTFANGPISSSPGNPITLDFIDWPADIGVTNIDWILPPPQNQNQPAPEPASVLLVASGLLGMGLSRRRWSGRRPPV